MSLFDSMLEKLGIADSEFAACCERPWGVGGSVMRLTENPACAWRTTVVALMSATMLPACGGQNESVPAPPASGGDAAPAESSSGATGPLAGTRWQLVEFQSMDDAQGTTRPEDPSVYTMQLNSDGTVAMQLNCNRANGMWTAQPAADPTNGTFGFGPLAMTRALCSPPSMDERIARDSEYVRGYMLRDGRLGLSLMADGGIYLWEPAAE